MTNLDGVLKSRDITLMTKVHIVKAMVFPVFMYRRKLDHERRQSAEELMLLNCGAGEDSRVPWTARRSNQSIVEEINSIFIGRTDAEAETAILGPPYMKN